MTDVPVEIPFTTPEERSTEATPVALLVHVPPEVVFPRVAEAPTHMAVGPVIAGTVGSAFTESACSAEVVPPHPPESV